MNPQQSGRRTRVVPVIDVMGGQVVRAVGGRRELYQPLVSHITHSTDPAVVAAAILKLLGVNELYVADIDGLMGHRPRLGWIAGLTGRGVRVMVDAGVKQAADARAVAETGADVVAGTETLEGLNELNQLVNTFGPDRVVLSVDLRNGLVVGSEAAWGMDPNPVEVVRQGIGVGARRVIVLELARVGTGIGPGTVGLCKDVRAAFPDLELIAGGGVRDRADVAALATAGSDGVLVASAIHDGNLTSD